MPSLLKRRYRQSLRLDQPSKQLLQSKLNVSMNAGTFTREIAASGCSVRRSRSRGKHRTPRRTHLPSRSPTASRFLRRRSSASFHSPVSGAILPVELLLRIFHLGADLHYEFPVAVSQVCSLWRSLALQSPKLWQVIRPDARRVLCDRRIRRSRGLPLHVDIVWPRGLMTGTSTMADVHSRMTSVLPARKQWRSLSLRFDGYCPFLWNSALSGLCARPSRSTSSVPELESLSLVYPANDDTKEFHLFADHAPKLRHVMLHGIRLQWSSLFANLVSLDYTHHGFSMGYEAVHEVLDMLAVCQGSLETLSVRFPETCGSSQSDIWHVDTYYLLDLLELQCVKKFVIRAEGHSVPPREFVLLVSKLLLPSLITLELDTLDNSGVFSRKVIRSTVRPFWRHPQIKQLIVRRAWNYVPFINSLAHSLPNLSELVLEKM